jgi:hypothetical protein
MEYAVHSSARDTHSSLRTIHYSTTPRLHHARRTTHFTLDSPVPSTQYAMDTRKCKLHLACDGGNLVLTTGRLRLQPPLPRHGHRLLHQALRRQCHVRDGRFHRAQQGELLLSFFLSRFPLFSLFLAFFCCSRFLCSFCRNFFFFFSFFLLLIVWLPSPSLL